MLSKPIGVGLKLQFAMDTLERLNGAGLRGTFTNTTGGFTELVRSHEVESFLGKLI